MITCKNILNRRPSQPWISFACCRARKKKIWLQHDNDDWCLSQSMHDVVDGLRSLPIHIAESELFFSIFWLLPRRLFDFYCRSGGAASRSHSFCVCSTNPIVLSSESIHNRKCRTYEKNLNLCLYACCFRLCRWFTHQFRQGERAN